MLCSPTNTTHKLQPDWVVTLLWGRLIVFRWGNLRRGSGKEDRSRELKDQRRKAEGNKLVMCRIFSFRSGFWWETCRHFICFFLSLGNPQLGHTLQAKIYCAALSKVSSCPSSEISMIPTFKSHSAKQTTQWAAGNGDCRSGFTAISLPYTCTHTVPLSGQCLLVHTLTEFVHKWP